MQIGDPRKALVLAIVALLIIGVAVFRAIPHSPAPPAMTLTPRADEVAAKDQAKQPVSTLPTTLTSEPFAKPKPPPAQPANLPTPPPMTPNSGLAPVSPNDIAGQLQTIPDPLARSGHPSENTGLNRKVLQDTPVLVTLQGVVRITRRIAIIMVSSKPSQPLQCEVGSEINGYKLIALSDSSVTLQKEGKKTILLSIGKSRILL